MDDSALLFGRGIVFKCLGDSLVGHFKILLLTVPQYSHSRGTPHQILFRRLSQVYNQGAFLILIGGHSAIITGAPPVSATLIAAPRHTSTLNTLLVLHPDPKVHIQVGTVCHADLP